jgi:DNA invertase Pin-like site-specific DNA recombinase
MARVVLVLTSRRAGRPPRCVEPELVKDLRSLGLSFRQIARRTGFGYGSVRRALQGVVTTARESPQPD